MADGSDRVREAFNNGENVEPINNGDTPPPQEQDTKGLHRKCAQLPLNDFGNGQRFSGYFGGDVMFVPRVSWFCWSGKQWCKDQDILLVRGLAQKVAKEIMAEAEFADLEDWEKEKLECEGHLKVRRDSLDALNKDRTPEQAKELLEVISELVWVDRIKQRKYKLKSDHRNHAKASGNSAKIDNMMKESTVKQSRNLDDLDADPLVLNVNNGILKFTVDRAAQRTMRDDGCSDMEGTVKVTFVPHDRSQMLSKMMPVDYEPDAVCPQYHVFINRILPDREVSYFMQRWYGLSMTGLIGEQKLVYQYGDGSNGKSVLVDLIANMMGEYSATAAIESLTGTQKRSGGEATPDLIPLIGARMVRASEPEEGERLREAEIKKMTGGEPIQMRANYGDTIEVLPKFKLTISGNHKLEIRGTDNGIWRRILLVKFGVIIPKEERDEDLPEKLWAERSGILNWLIEGLVSYLENGLQEPEAVLNETKAYREESDPVGAFFAACCEFDANAPFLKSAELMKAFRLWQTQEGQTPWQPGTITARISKRAGKYRDPVTGLQYHKHKYNVSGYLGVRLTSAHSLALDEYEMKHSKSYKNGE